MYRKRLAFAIVSGVGAVCLLILLQMANAAPTMEPAPDRLAFASPELLAESDMAGETRTSPPPTSGLPGTSASVSTASSVSASSAATVPTSKLSRSVTLRAEITTTTAPTTSTLATWNSTTSPVPVTSAGSSISSTNPTGQSVTITTSPTSSQTSVTQTNQNPVKGDKATDDAKLVYFNDFGTGALDKENWDRYHSPGHAGWGFRRPSAISVVPMEGVAGGHGLQITAAMGTGDEAGKLVSGGLMLRGREQRYGRYTARIRVDADPAEVTSGVALLWPASGQWPAGGEIDFFEGWGNRATRNPVESHLHWADAAGNDTTTDVTHAVYGTDWHVYQLDWRPDQVSVSVDGASPVILSTARSEIPQWPMNLAIQLDGFDAPHAQGQQPTLTQPVRLQVDWVKVEAYD